MKTTYQMLPAVIAWAVDAAKEHVELARFSNEEPDSETTMGLWQSFQAAFPVTPGVDRDMLVTAYSHTYTETVKMLTPIIKPRREPESLVLDGNDLVWK